MFPCTTLMPLSLFIKLGLIIGCLWWHKLLFGRKLCEQLATQKFHSGFFPPLWAACPSAGAPVVVVAAGSIGHYLQLLAVQYAKLLGLGLWDWAWSAWLAIADWPGTTQFAESQGEETTRCYQWYVKSPRPFSWPLLKYSWPLSFFFKVHKVWKSHHISNRLLCLIDFYTRLSRDVGNKRKSLYPKK